MHEHVDKRSFLLESWLEFHDMIVEHPEVRRLLFDPVTGLPTTPLLFPRIESLLEERGEISLLCLSVVKYSKIEETHGWEVFDDVMRGVAASLERITGRELRDSDMVAELMISGNAFVVLLSPPRTTDYMDCDSLQALARRIENLVREDLAAALDASVFPLFGCYVGAAAARHDPQMRLERLVYQALEEALADSDARERGAAGQRNRNARLEEIIAAGDVHTLAQPVLRLGNLEIVGYQALCRGPEASEFERPEMLCAAAYDADLVTTLERLCRKQAFEAAERLPEGRMLFVGIEPEAVEDPELRDIILTTLVASSNVRPADVVFEISERAAVVDFPAFRATLEYLRTLGFQVAVVDGSGGSGSLRCLAGVRPGWLKIDPALIRDIDFDDVRRGLVHGLVSLTQRIDVKLIAEGIERPEQLKVLRELGVVFGQGSLFSVPLPPYPADDQIAYTD